MAASLAMKGFRGTIQRAAILPVRYGATTSKIHRCLNGMISLCERFDFEPTIATTVSVLDRHRELVSSLGDVDVAVHGFHHVAYSRLTREQQANDLELAIRTLNRLGLSARGFRAPYLSVSRDTPRLLRSRGFLFDSSSIEVSLPEGHSLSPDLLDLIRTRYGSQIQSPTYQLREEGPIEFPVSLPDDELLVEGLRIRNSKVLFRILESMLLDAKSRSSLLVLQIHPERYQIFSDALELVLRKSQDEGACRLSLGEAAEWIIHGGSAPQGWPHGASYALAVTGDLDAASLSDFAPRIGGIEAWKS